MPNSPTWIVCERTGRWAAAIRVALARQPTKTGHPIAAPRVQEVRTLAEFEAATNSLQAVGMLEVRADNLAAVLELLAKGWRRNVRIVALLDSELHRTAVSTRAQSPIREESVDILTEAGALAVVSSPRQILTAIRAAEQYGESRRGVAMPSGEQESIVDRAWAAVPWQGA